MAVYHCSIKEPLSRGKGKSLIRKAAYNARTQFNDERTGEVSKDYAYKGGLIESFVTFDPKSNAPEWFKTDPQRMLNAAVKAEKRKDAREGQEIVFGFIDELGLEKNRYMLNDFLREQFTRKEIGRVAVVNIHAPSETGDQRNTHAHVLLLLRAAGPEGFGQRLPALEPEDYERIRQKWAEKGAKEMRKLGPEFTQEADRYAEGWRPLEQQRQAALERGDLAYAETLNREASRHRGPAVDAQERRDIETERGNAYRDTAESNAQAKQNNQDLKIELAEVQKAIADYERRWAEKLAQAATQKKEKQPTAAANTAKGQQEKEPQPAPELGRTAGEIRLAYGLTHSGQSFANALEDRGLILAVASEADAQRLNRWEAARLRELAAAAPTVPQQTQTTAAEKPLIRQDTWMAQTGGVDALTPQLMEQAQASYDKWEGNKGRYSLDNYVDYVQKREAERQQEPGQQREQKRETPEYQKYKAGELLVINQRGDIYKLTRNNTGDDAKTRAAHLKGVDRAPLLSVSAAQSAMQQLREQQRGEWENRTTEPRPQLTAPAKQPERTGVTADIWQAFQHNDSAASIAAELAEKGLTLAVATKEEADRSHRAASFARATGNTATRLNEGEIVVMTSRGHVYRLNERTTGASAAEAQQLLQTLDTSQLQGIEATKEGMQTRAANRAAVYAQRAESERTGVTLDIWQALQHSDSPASFAVALQEKGMVFAVASKDEADRSHRAASFARATGNNAAQMQQGEIVAVTSRGHVYRLNERTTGANAAEMQRYMQTLDTSRYQSINATKETMHNRASANAQEQAQERYGRGSGNDHLQKEVRDRAERMSMRNELASSPKEQQHIVLDRETRRTMQNEKAANEARNTRDR